MTALPAMNAQQELQTPLSAQPLARTVLLEKLTATLVPQAFTAQWLTTSPSPAMPVTTVRLAQMNARFALLDQAVRTQTQFQDSAPSVQTLGKGKPTAQAALLVQPAPTMEPLLSVALGSFLTRMALFASTAPLAWLALPNSGTGWSCVVQATIPQTA